LTPQVVLLYILVSILLKSIRNRRNARSNWALITS